MAARYWVGGTGTWSSTNTTNWSATSGGAGGASVPGPADSPRIDINSGTGTITFTNSAVTVNAIVFNTSNITLSLNAALTCNAEIIFSQGTFTTNNYNVTAVSFTSDSSTARTLNLGSSVITLTSTSSALSFASQTGLVFNAGTSTFNLTGTSSSIIIETGLTFYNFSFTNTAKTTCSIRGSNTFNNLTIAGRASSGVSKILISQNQIINGILTLSKGTNATCRTFILSDINGTTRTLTVNSFASGSAEIDFKDITIIGTAAPISGARFGDCKGNSGITFGAGVSKYWNLAVGGNWSAVGWALTSGGTPAINNFPLAQDTCYFEATGLNSGATININDIYTLGTVNMSARTSNTMTLTPNTCFVVGDWINGTGTTISSGGQSLTFAAYGNQTITSAGKLFPRSIVIQSFGGTVTLQDALIANDTGVLALHINAGTFNANGYSVTVLGYLNSTGTNIRTIDFGTGTWTLQGARTEFTDPTNLTILGTATVNFTSSLAKFWESTGLDTTLTINQGSTSTLTIRGSNKFANLTNTAIGRIQFIGGTTNEFTNFSINGIAGNLLPLGSSNTVQVILKKPTAWNVGANSTNAGNNTGLSFTAGGNDYLSVSYVNGQLSAAPTSAYFGNFFLFF